MPACAVGSSAAVAPPGVRAVSAELKTGISPRRHFTTEARRHRGELRREGRSCAHEQIMPGLSLIWEALKNSHGSGEKAVHHGGTKGNMQRGKECRAGIAQSFHSSGIIIHSCKGVYFQDEWPRCRPAQVWAECYVRWRIPSGGLLGRLRSPSRRACRRTSHAFSPITNHFPITGLSAREENGRIPAAVGTIT